MALTFTTVDISALSRLCCCGCCGWAEFLAGRPSDNGFGNMGYERIHSCINIMKFVLNTKCLHFANPKNHWQNCKYPYPQ